MGGAWERVIRTVKEAIYRIINNTALTDYQLQTNFVEIEVIVKNRSLTDDSDHCKDAKALTSNHFLIRKYSNVSESFSKTTEAFLNIRKRSRQVQFLEKMNKRKPVNTTIS